MSDHELDHGVREIAVATPKLRTDLRIVFQEFRGKPTYLLEDFTNRKFYRIGLPEHQFLTMLDGKTSVTEALSHSALVQCVRNIVGEDALTEQNASTLIRWLMDSELLESAGADQAMRRFDAKSKAKKKKPGAGLNKVLFFKIPLGNPDAFIRSILPYFRPMLGWAFFVVWLIVLAYAGMALSNNWPAFVSATKAAFLPSNWLWLGIVFLGLKFIHELWHGLITRKFGGAVPEWGVQLLLFVTPLTYADASTSWSFPSRWHRIYVAAAGMYIELFIGAIAALVWASTDPGFVNTIAYNAVFSASVVTILFNANPLLRFDGYYILSDLTSIPNLGTKGQQFMGWVGKRVFLGAKETPMPQDAKERPIIIPLYGVLALMWRAVIYTGILITLSLFFKGAGMVLAALIVLSVIYTWIKKLIGVFTKSKGRVFVGRALIRTGMIAACLFALLFFVKVNPAARAVAVVEFADKKIIRAGCSGFVKEVVVENGQHVAEGDVIIRMANPDEVLRRDEMKTEIELTNLRIRYFRSVGETAQVLEEQNNVRALEEQLAELEEYISQLEVTSPIDGYVRIKGTESLPGRYFRQGDSLCMVTPSEEKEILLSIQQEDLDIIKDHVRRQSEENDGVVNVESVLRGHPGTVKGVIEQIEESASLNLPHPSLSSQSGGPLIVRGASAVQNDPTGGINEDPRNDLGQDPESAQVELIKPRFGATARIDKEFGATLGEGEWGYARFEGLEQERLGSWLYHEAYNYINAQWELMQQFSAN